MLVEIFGINASGKDSIAKAIAERHSNVRVVTESRLLMYHLGIIDSFTADFPVSTEQYKQLENTNQETILAMTNGAYRQDLEKFSQSEETTLLLSHLVFLLHIDKKPTFLDQKDPPFLELFTGLVQVKAGTSSILERRKKDNSLGVRKRNHSAVDIVEKHQTLCDKKWEKITVNRAQGWQVSEKF